MASKIHRTLINAFGIKWKQYTGLIYLMLRFLFKGENINVNTNVFNE